MKYLLAFLLLSLSALSATHAQQRVFGPLAFGADEATAQNYLETFCKKQKFGNLFTAESIMENFVPLGWKDRLKFASQKRKSRFQLCWQMSEQHTLEWLNVLSLPFEPSAYETDLKEAWSLLAEIATTKFGQPSCSTELPKMQAIPDMNHSPKWRFGGMIIFLCLTEPKGSGGPHLYGAQLVATVDYTPEAPL
ncbi:MAG: hypothetical protein ACFUZC_00835 [Chthoniobacteraceae bacterium]